MKKITNYHELAVEKHRLQQKLALLKREIDNEIHEIKQRFSPITKIVGLVTGNGDSSADGTQKDSFLKTGLKAGGALAIDLLVGRQLAKAGMITKLIVPPLLKGISSKVIGLFRRKK